MGHKQPETSPRYETVVGRVGIEPTTLGLKVAKGVSATAYEGTNSELVDRFISDRKARGLSPRTLTFYANNLSYLTRVGNGPLLALTRTDLQALLMSLTCNAGGRMAYLRAWRAFYAWAEESEYIAASPCRRMRLKVPKPLRYAVPVGALPRLLAACETLRDRLIITMLADTGLRQSELASVRPENVNAEASTVRVWGKGAKERVVRYGPQTAALLDAYVTTRTEGPTLLNLEARGVAIMLYRLGKATGIKCNAHAFRRLFASQSVRNGLNLFYVQSLLGHATLTMTRIYAEAVNSEDAIKAYKPIVG